MPDYLHGDAIAAEDLNSGKVDLPAWIGKHGKDVTRPAIDKVIAHLKGQGVQNFAAIGYCFGESPSLANAHRGRSWIPEALLLSFRPRARAPSMY